MASSMNHLLILIHRYIFSRRWLYSFNLHAYKLLLRSLGVLNADSEDATGEPWLRRKLVELEREGKLSMKVIVDVGANDLAYGRVEFPNAKIYAFEPLPDSFHRLQQGAARNVVPINAAVGDHAGTTDFWDFDDSAPRKSEQPTSQLASVHRDVIEKLYGQPAKKYRVKMTTLDAFARARKIEHIDFLKIDAEGNELAVLKGAQRLLASNKIDTIQFEFNEIHAYSRVFMKDFYDVLPGFTFYRLLPTGAVALGPYRPLTHEIFGFQNIVAVRNTLSVPL